MGADDSTSPYNAGMPEPLNVLVTMPFDKAKLDRMRAVSPRLSVTRSTAETADYARADILYAVTVPADLVVEGGRASRAPRLKWVQFHMGRREHAPRST